MFLIMADGNRNSLIAVATIFLIFVSVGKGAYQDCVTTLRNIVVYEGTLDTILGCSTGPNGSAWSVRPTSKALTANQITNFNDVISPTLTNLYAINGSGLIVRNATITPTDGPISTAGLYFVRFPGTTNQTAAKLVVIRSGPNCSCIQLASDAVNISCNIVYADHPVAPIKEIINCTANGQVYTLNTPTRTPIVVNTTSTLYVYDSTSTITINDTAPTTYDCKLTFSAPPPSDLVKYPYLARNAPDFSVSFTVCESPTTTARSTTTPKPPTTTTKPPTTTSKPPATTTKPPITTEKMTTTTSKVAISTELSSTVTRLSSTSAELSPSTTISGKPTTTAQPTTISQPLTTIKVPTTTVPPITTTATTVAPSMTTKPPTATVQQPTVSSQVGLSPTSAELNLESTATTKTSTQPLSISTTSAQLTPTSTESTTTPSPNEIDLLTTKIILGTILGILMAALAVVGCSWCCLYFCPPLLPLRRPTLLPFRRPIRYFDGENQMFQRREWIPMGKEIRQTEYWAIPFYKQSFTRYRNPCEYRLPSRYPTPYEYRLPSRCRCVQSCATQPPSQECRCGYQARIKAYCGP